MTKEELFAVLNRGIPNYLTVKLNIETIIKECATNETLLREEFVKVRNDFQDYLIIETQHAKSNHMFFGNLSVRCLRTNSETVLLTSPMRFITNLKDILGVTTPTSNLNDPSLKTDLQLSIARIRDIKSPEELKEKYPVIYQDYLLAQELYAKINQLKEELRTHETPELRSQYNELWRRYNSYGLDTRFEEFLNKQYYLYNSFYRRRTFIENHCNHTPIDLSSFPHLDQEKFELYLADKYLKIANSTKNNDERQKCIYYLVAYFREAKVSNVKIKNDLGEVISFKKLYSTFKKIIALHPELKAIYEPRKTFANYNHLHTENHIHKYYDNLLDWYFIPSSEDEPSAGIIEYFEKHYTYLSPKERAKKELSLLELLKRKKEFFASTNPVTKLYGKGDFDGYIAYIYDNGEVIMEKFYEDYIRGIPARENAIYNFKVADFEELSKKGKLELMKDKRVKRINHTETFEERTRPIIEKPATSTSQQEVDALILKLKK